MQQRSVTTVEEKTLTDGCPVCDATPVVLVALGHPVMRRWTEELLESEHGCWEVTRTDEHEMVADAIARVRPDLVVVDESDFPACCRAALDRMRPERVIVVSPEPDAAYRTQAFANGAGGWVSRDHVADELSCAMRVALGCGHRPCPPSPRSSVVSGAGTSLSGGRSR